MSDDRLLLYIEFGMGWAGVDGLLYVLTGLIGLAVNRAGPGRHYVPHHRPEHGMRNKPYWPGQDVDSVVSCRARIGSKFWDAYRPTSHRPYGHLYRYVCRVSWSFLVIENGKINKYANKMY